MFCSSCSYGFIDEQRGDTDVIMFINILHIELCVKGVEREIGTFA